MVFGEDPKIKKLFFMIFILNNLETDWNGIVMKKV